MVLLQLIADDADTPSLLDLDLDEPFGTNTVGQRKMTSVAKFRIKPGGESFTRADFEMAPAWSEHYDLEELDVIASWGVDRSWVAQQFRAMDTGGAHPNYTILDLDRLPHDNRRIFLKAEFQHRSGKKIDGYIMNDDAYCIGLFLRSDDFIFSRNSLLRSMMLPKKEEAEVELGVAELFPLAYRTRFLDRQGKPVAGEFLLEE